MTDEKLIKFDKLKDKILSHEYEKFEKFIQAKNTEYISGKISFEGMINEVDGYMRNLKESGVDIIEFQKKMMRNMGLDPDTVEGREEIDEKFSKINLDKVFTKEENELIKNKTFISIFDNAKEKSVLEYIHKSEKNDIKMIFDRNEIILVSEKTIDFSDDILNELIMVYKDIVEDDLKIISCEATRIYEYNKK